MQLFFFFGILGNKNIVSNSGIGVVLIMKLLLPECSYPINGFLLFPLQDGGHRPFYGM